MKKNIFIVLTLLLISCNEAKEINSSNVLDLDMNSSKEISFDEWVAGVECIQLSGSETNLYQGIIEYNSFFYLHLQNDRSVSVYKKSGEHVRTIKNKQGMMPVDIFINEKENQLWVIESFQQIGKYSLDGDLIEQQKLPFMAAKIAQAGADHYLFYDGGFDKTTPYFLRIIADNDFSTISESVSKHNTFNNVPDYTFANNNKEIFICLTKNDTIYVCDKTSLNITPRWHLNFSGDFLTHRDEPEGGFSDKIYAEILKENKKYTDIRGFHCVNNFIFMRLLGKDNSFRAIDISNNYTYRFNTLIDNINIPPQGSTTDGFLVVMTSQEFIRHYSTPDNSTKYESIKDMLNQINNNNNGLIVIKIKLREDLP